MSLQLPEHVSFCFIDGRAIFLDLARDRYFSLDDQVANAFARILDSEGADDTDDLAILARSGLGEPGRIAPRPEAAPAHVPTRSILEDAGPAAKIAARDALEITITLLKVRRGVRSGRLKTLVESLAANKRRRGGGETALARRVAGRFAAARRLAPVPHNCLTDSLALMIFLGRRDTPAELVFGVKLHPFAAHAWVQTCDELLNERADAAAEFTPILVI